MLCSFDRIIYPHGDYVSSPSGFMVATYTPHEKVLDASGEPMPRIKAVGYLLPTVKGVQYDLQGRWEHSSYGPQYAVTDYTEQVQPTEAGIIAYLSSGYIKGIGEKLAKRIYDQFGSRTLEILDHEPERLLEVKGISQSKLQSISDSYLENRGARDIITLLAPFGISPRRAVRFYKVYGRDAANIVREHPYRLCEIHGIGFKTADAVAQQVGLDPCSEERIEAGLLHVLKDAESMGHLCVPREKVCERCHELLSTPEITKEQIATAFKALLNRREMVVYRDQAYRYPTAMAEEQVAWAIRQRMKNKAVHGDVDLDAEISRFEQKLKVALASEQRAAIKTCLCAPVSIITGGPGTGKTMIQKFILELYQKLKPDGTIVCCAPTGRAARRMEQATGYPASTVHKALGLMADSDGEYGAPMMLDADLVIADEVSMLDIYLARHLLSALPDPCQLVLIGDADQLPSVGPGNVLHDLIACGKIPTVKLDKVYRQDAGSRIAMNAALIRHGTMALEYGPDFELIESGDFQRSMELLETEYLKKVQVLGLDNVALLSPFRTKTLTGVNTLNSRLQYRLNPPCADKPELRYGKRSFRQGDKVMQTQNKGPISNGDIGIVTGVVSNAEEKTLYVDFGDGRFMEYAPSDLDTLTLAYATTIHKSQGSEYDTVILNLQSAHYIMLHRPLLYTAITRAKRRVVIVGERKALCMAINQVDTEKRGTMLAQRIREG